MNFLEQVIAEWFSHKGKRPQLVVPSVSSKSLTWRNGTTVSYLSSLMTPCGAWLLAVLRTLRHPGSRRCWGRR